MNELFPIETTVLLKPEAVVAAGDGERLVDDSVHGLLIEKGAKYLQHLKCVVVITDLTHYGGETPDVIGWFAGGGSVLIECKASRADFRADRHKSFRRYPEMGMGDARYYLAPKGLLKPEEMPKGWGLLEWTGKKVVLVKRSEGFAPKGLRVARRQEMSVMVSAMRRLGCSGVKGLSVRAYTYDSKCRATVGVMKE